MKNLSVKPLDEKQSIEILERLDRNFIELSKDVKEIKADVGALKSDVSVLKSDVSVLKSDVAVLKSDVKDLKRNMNDLMIQNGEILEKMVTQDEFQNLSHRVATLETQ